MRAPRRWRRDRPGRTGALEKAEQAGLETRVERLEAALEDLQDALYRHAVAYDKQLGELRARTKPQQIARDLSEDARKRGI
jgi:hypothetical protein